MRDDFAQGTKDMLAKRVNYRCSNPNCGALTVAALPKNKGTQSIGVAAHITAAAPGGKRYDPILTTDERCSIDNGIWLCQNCATLIDRDADTYSTMRLVIWKNMAEQLQLEEYVTNKKAMPAQERSSSNDDIQTLFYLLRSAQECYTHLYDFYNLSFSHFSHPDEILDYLERYPIVYKDSIEEPIEKLKYVMGQLESLLPMYELKFDYSIVKLFREFINLGKFPYQHDMIGLHNDYIARFFENVLTHQPKRTDLCDKIEKSFRAQPQ